MIKIQQTIVNKKGERLVFDEITKYESFYLTKLDGNVGLLDEDGIEIIKPLYDKICLTTYGCFVVEKNKLCGLVNAVGEFIIPLKYSAISLYCKEDMVRIYLGEKVGFFNLITHFTIEPIYDDADDFFRGISKVENEGKYGLINKLGEEILPLECDYISEFYEDVAVYSIDKKYGYIRRDGFKFLSAVYDEVTGFNNGYGFAKQGKSYICVDKSGKIIFLLNISAGILHCNERWNRLLVDWCEEYIKFDCGLNLIKENGLYRCESDNGYSVNQIFYE